MAMLIYIAVSLFLITLIGMIIFLSRSLGYYDRKDEDYERNADIESKRKDISARPISSADDILHRMRTESWDK